MISEVDEDMVIWTTLQNFPTSSNNTTFIGKDDIEKVVSINIITYIILIQQKGKRRTFIS